MKHEPQTHGTANALRPFIYVRSATNEDGQLQQRVEDARELAHLHGLDVAAGDTIAEHGSGASIDGRPGIQRILEQAARGEISHLVTPRFSYLSRNSRDQYQIFEVLAEAGVKIVTGAGTNEPREAYAVATAAFDTLR